MAHQPVRLAGAAPCYGFRAGGITEHIRTALLFRHAHADEQSAFLRAGQQVGIVAIACQRGLPVGEQRRQMSL
ncbi:hypothetical protein ES15_0497 [Cronobacter sakazakii ES15]|nr:hypothetical protein ES15_0497 [Cronobacter sakazakii ES15]